MARPAFRREENKNMKKLSVQTLTEAALGAALMIICSLISIIFGKNTDD